MTNADVFQIIRLDERDKFFSLVDSLNINQVNEFGQTLLHEAVSSGSTILAIELIKRKININEQDKNGLTPLHYAALHNSPKIANCIVENSGNLNIEDIHGNQPLWTAVFNAKGNYEIVKIFMEYGADAYHKNYHGRSPLDFAKQIRDEQLVEILQKIER